MSFKKLSVSFIVLTILFSVSGCQNKVLNTSAEKPKVKSILIFSKTAGWRHKSIEVGIKALEKLAKKEQIKTIASENAIIFNDKDLKQFSAVVFLNTTGDILNDSQQLAFERYVQAGGGVVGIHAATDTEHDWHWFGRMIGARFKNHPKIQMATLNVVDKSMAKELPATFDFKDEWYNFHSLSEHRKDILTLDETSYKGGKNGSYHPISWYQNFDGGRVFYTGLGHRNENYSDPLFLKSLSQGLRYAIGQNSKLDYTKSKPEQNRFVKKVLVSELNEPVSLELTADATKVLWIERKGQIYWYDLLTDKKLSGGNIPIYSAEGFGEFGLLTVALDPNFNVNQHAYFMFNLKYKESDEMIIQRISRFTFKNDVIDLNSEVVMIDIPSDDTCCHTGGNMEFDDKGHLYIAIGDNTNPFRSKGVGPTDNRPDHAIDDALRSAANTQDLRGKILRIIPKLDGSYGIPKDNLFKDSSQGKPEIYVMGARNPYTLAYDAKTSELFYGDVGPDNRIFSPKRGAKGFDEINRVKAAGNFGWPMFVGFNQAYRYFDHVTNKAGEWYKTDSPINKSPRNTGISLLPPAQEPIIAYPYGISEQFPELGAGSRNALVAGVYRTPESINVANTNVKPYPSYYDGKLFISDFMRRWIKVASFNKDGQVYKIEDFAPEANLVAPLDLKFSRNGELFILEYGSKWHSGNDDAKLSVINYIGEGNRPPIAKITVNHTKGAKPFTVLANGNSSLDPDNDKLSYRWQIQSLEEATALEQLTINSNNVIFDRAAIDTQILNNGKYALVLEVTDSNGDQAYARQMIEVGNAPPKVEITFDQNQTFMFPEGVKYQVNVKDKEDGRLNQGISAKDVYVSLKKLNKDMAKNNVGHANGDPFAKGRKAVKDNNCLGCHQLTQKSVGPSFRDIADRYNTKTDNSKYLTQVIAAGSTGKWGQHQMPAHDFLKTEVRSEIASYILSQHSPAASMDMQGNLEALNGIDQYQLSVRYTDKGLPGFEPISTLKTSTLITPKVTVADFIKHTGDLGGVSKRGGNKPMARFFNHGASLFIGEYDLSSITHLKFSQYYSANLNKEAVLKVRIGSVSGKVIAQGKFDYSDNTASLKKDDEHFLRMKLKKPVNAIEALYLVVSEPNQPGVQAFQLGTVEFISKP